MPSPATTEPWSAAEAFCGVLAKRWIVERSFMCIGQSRRLIK
jgi:hypothetical protein